jgi:hypothetical protein
MKANCAPEALAASSVTPRRAGGQAMIAGSSAARVSPQPDAEACGVEIDHGDRSGLGGLHCQMQRQRGFPNPAFLGDDRNCLHVEPSSGRGIDAATC